MPRILHKITRSVSHHISCCYHRELIPLKQRALIVCVCKVEPFKMPSSSQRGNGVNKRAPAHTNTCIYTRWGAQMRTPKEKRCIAEPPENDNPRTGLFWGVRMQTHGCTLGNAVCMQPGVREQVQWMQLKEFDDWGNLNTRAVIPFAHCW